MSSVLFTIHKMQKTKVDVLRAHINKVLRGVKYYKCTVSEELLNDLDAMLAAGAAPGSKVAN